MSKILTSSYITKVDRLKTKSKARYDAFKEWLLFVEEQVLHNTVLQ